MFEAGDIVYRVYDDAGGAYLATLRVVRRHEDGWGYIVTGEKDAPYFIMECLLFESPLEAIEDHLQELRSQREQIERDIEHCKELKDEYTLSSNGQ